MDRRRVAIWSVASAALAGLAVASCSVVGLSRVEEPSWQLVETLGAVEIRAYGPRVAAETMVPGDPMRARETGFRRVAGYIFGANRSGDKIAMTAPVAQAPEADGSRIAFFMPAARGRATLPAPSDPAVRLVDVPAQTVAVLRFSGARDPDAIEDRKARLLAAVAASRWRPIGPAETWLYDPPWTLPPFRRNEVAVVVSRPVE